MLKGLSNKKLHEISVITDFLKDKNIKHILEIGGGKGNLSFVLCYLYQTKALSIDMNKEF